jgi:hypothetical protein
MCLPVCVCLSVFWSGGLSRCVCCLPDGHVCLSVALVLCLHAVSQSDECPIPGAWLRLQVKSADTYGFESSKSIFLDYPSSAKGGAGGVASSAGDHGGASSSRAKKRPSTGGAAGARSSKRLCGSTLHPPCNSFGGANADAMAADVIARYMHLSERCSDDVLNVLKFNELKDWPEVIYQHCLMTEEASQNHACPWSIQEVDRCREAIPIVLKTKDLSSLAVTSRGASLLGSQAFYDAMVTQVTDGQASSIRPDRPWAQSCLTVLDGQQVTTDKGTGTFSVNGREIDRPGAATFVLSQGYHSDTLVRDPGSSRFKLFSSLMEQMLTCAYYIVSPIDGSSAAVHTETIQELSVVVKKKILQDFYACLHDAFGPYVQHVSHCFDTDVTSDTAGPPGDADELIDILALFQNNYGQSGHLSESRHLFVEFLRQSWLYSIEVNCVLETVTYSSRKPPSVTRFPVLKHDHPEGQGWLAAAKPQDQCEEHQKQWKGRPWRSTVELLRIPHPVKSAKGSGPPVGDFALGKWQRAQATKDNQLGSNEGDLPSHGSSLPCSRPGDWWPAFEERYNYKPRSMLAAWTWLRKNVALGAAGVDGSVTPEGREGSVPPPKTLLPRWEEVLLPSKFPNVRSAEGGPQQGSGLYLKATWPEPSISLRRDEIAFPHYLKALLSDPESDLPLDPVTGVVRFQVLESRQVNVIFSTGEGKTFRLWPVPLLSLCTLPCCGVWELPADESAMCPPRVNDQDLSLPQPWYRFRVAFLLFIIQLLAGLHRDHLLPPQPSGVSGTMMPESESLPRTRLDPIFEQVPEECVPTGHCPRIIFPMLFSWTGPKVLNIDTFRDNLQTLHGDRMQVYLT